jgi:SAM-dependent methyltransferase
MFGETIDYWLLRPFCHARNRATEEELNQRAAETPFTREEALAYLERTRTFRFGGRLPLKPELSYLDIGCGTGQLVVGLLEGGARDVTGIDIVPRHVAATAAIAERLGWQSQLKLECIDVHRWNSPQKYDVVVVLGALEHIHDPKLFLARLPELLKENGRICLSFEPYHSPIGDHCQDFFRFPIPWRGALFSEAALIRLRREFYRPTDPATRMRDVVAGMNQMRYGEFLRYAREAGLEIQWAGFTPQLKRYPPLYWASEVLCRIPLVRDYFVMMAFVVLRKK